MRIIPTTTVALGAALLLALTGASPSFAKAHDQGVAQGNDAKEGRFSGDTSAAAQTLGETQGKSENSGKKDK
jgi:hypothetical protein